MQSGEADVTWKVETSRATSVLASGALSYEEPKVAAAGPSHSAQGDPQPAKPRSHPAHPSALPAAATSLNNLLTQPI